MEVCPICGKEGKSIKYHFWRMHGDGVNHNPNKGYGDGTRVAWNKGLTIDDPRVKKNGESIAASWTPRGAILLSSEELSVNAKRNGFGGYRANAGRSKKFKVIDSFGKETTLQSSFELQCSEVLNSLGIKWNRPKALKYDGRNYFADFYLSEYDVWLDPKNSYKARLDKDKIQKVKEQNNVRLFVLLEEQLTKEYILQLLGNSEAE